MALIGEELRTILGMMPVRDRAGIARGTMADDAVRANAAAESGNAEGQALMQQGMRPARPAPPDIELPPEIGTAYASGRGDGSPPSAPVPTERVVAASPAAAPSQAVATQASDVMLAALEQRARQAKMMQLVGSLGMIANAFNRNPSSQSSTRSSLAGMVGGGGGEIGIPEIKAIADMKAQEKAAADYAALKATTVPELQRMFGWSKDRAEAAFASDEYKKWLDPSTIAKREEDVRGQRTRMDLGKPEVIDAITKRTGMPREVVEADIRSGKISQKELADLSSTQASTEHTQAQTGKLNIENMTALQRKAFVSDVTSSPEQYAKLWGVTPDEVRTAAHGGPEALQKLVEGIAPKKTDTQQNLAVENRMRKERGLPELTPSEYNRQSQQPHLKDAANEAEAVEYKKRMDEIRGHREKALEAKQFIEVENEAIGRKFTESPNLLLGPFSEKKLEARRFIGDLLKMPNKTVEDTDSFKAALKEYGLAVNKAFKGNFSDKDQATVDAIVGGSYTTNTLRDLLELREKHKLLEWQDARQKLKAGHADPKVGQTARDYVPDVEPPRMGAVMRKRFEAEGGEPTALEFLSKNRDNPKALATFDRQWGAGRAEYYLSQLPK